MEQAFDPLKNVDPSAARLLSIAQVKRYHALPVSLKNGVATVAIDDPSKLEVTDTIRFVLRDIKEVRFVQASKEAIIAKALDLIITGATPTQPGSGRVGSEIVSPTIDLSAEKF